VSGDGAIPVFARAYDGNAAEIPQVTDTIRALQKLAGPRSFLLVGDSKLISHTNVTAMNTAQVTFIAPLATSQVPDGLFAGLDPKQAEFVDYYTEPDEDTRQVLRNSYRVREDTMDLTGPRKKDPAHTLRRILVHRHRHRQRQRQRPGPGPGLGTQTREGPHRPGHPHPHRRHPPPPNHRSRHRQSHRDRPPPLRHRLPANHDQHRRNR